MNCVIFLTNYRKKNKRSLSEKSKIILSVYIFLLLTEIFLSSHCISWKQIYIYTFSILYLYIYIFSILYLYVYIFSILYIYVYVSKGSIDVFLINISLYRKWNQFMNDDKCWLEKINFRVDIWNKNLEWKKDIRR